MSNVLAFKRGISEPPKSAQLELFGNEETQFPTVNIGEHDLIIREFRGQRVVTFDVIDKLHGKVGAAQRNFSANKRHFIEGVDYFNFKGQEGRRALCAENFPNSSKLPQSNNFSFYLFTQTGYLMLAKSFQDNVAWAVQRELVNGYFRIAETPANMFNMMRKMIDVLEANSKALEDAQKQIEDNSNRLDAIDEMHDVEIDPTWMNASKVAKKMKLESTNGLPHASLVTAIASKAGINTNRRIKYKDEYVACVAKREGDTVFWELYFTPLGVDAINDWWHTNESKTRFVELYKRKSGIHAAGDVKEVGYQIGRRRYIVNQN